MATEMSFAELRVVFLEDFYELLKNKHADKKNLALSSEELTKIKFLVKLVDRCSREMGVEPRSIPEQKGHPNLSLLFYNFLKSVKWYGL